MKVGYATSIVGHLLLLSWGVLVLPAAQPLEADPIDALPIDIVPISDTTKLSEGVKTAPKRDTASQAPAKPPVPRPESQRAGNAPDEQKTPVTEKATETAAAREARPAAPPPPPPAPTPEPPKAAETPPPPPPEPEPAPPEPAPTEVAALDPAPPKAEVGEIAARPEPPKEEPPAPAPPTALPKSRPKPPAPVETAKVEDKPAPPKKTAPSRPAEPTPVAERKPDEEEFDPNELAALLNKVDESGGGARASEDPASLGSEQATGSVPEMSQSEIDALRARLISCWSPPIGGDGSDNMAVPVRFELNPDGSLASQPVARSIPPGPLGTVMAESATRAVLKCAPFDFLPPEKYDAWRVVNINFDPRDMY